MYNQIVFLSYLRITHCAICLQAGGGDGPKSPSNSTDSSEGHIEVVYNQEQPRPRGILKQRSRTLSDSSDDALSSSYNGGTSRQNSSNSTSAESPITEESGDDHSDDDEEDGKHGRRRNKSVSFSDHVDKATYKVNFLENGCTHW